MDDVRALHFTESLGGGVLTALVPIVQEQAKTFRQVVLLYIERSDTPEPSMLEEIIGSSVEIRRIPRKPRYGALRQIRREISSSHWDVVHLHSSWAGVLGRLLGYQNRARIVYSPHGFGFLRTDIPRISRKLIQISEKMLASLSTGTICVSQGEADVAPKSVGRPNRVVVLENSLSLNSLPERRPPGLGESQRPVVVSVGRITYQKAPWRFAFFAQQLSSIADFTWIGGGSDGDTARWIGDAPVRVTGWMEHSRTLDELARADIFILGSLWEGLPVSLMEAQALGVPAVVSDVVGNRDIVFDEVTGRVFRTDEEAVQQIRDLLTDEELRLQFGREASKLAIERFDRRDVAQRSLHAYSTLIGI